MKKLLCMFVVMVMAMSTTLNVWAQTEFYGDTEVEEATIVNMKVLDDEVSVTGVTRGQYLSSVELNLTNEGFGVAGISAIVLCHEPMQRIKVRLTLEKKS